MFCASALGLFGVHLEWSFFGIHASGAPMPPPENMKNHVKIKVWDFLGDPLGVTHLDFPVRAQVPMQRGAHFPFCRGAAI